MGWERRKVQGVQAGWERRKVQGVQAGCGGIVETGDEGEVGGERGRVEWGACFVLCAWRVGGDSSTPVPFFPLSP